MDLYDDVAATLPFLRSQAEKMMIDRIQFWVPEATVDLVLDETTGLYPEASKHVFYTGRCQIRELPALLPTFPTPGDAPVTIERVQVKIPYGSPGIPLGALGRITHVGRLSDRTLCNQLLRIVGTREATFVSARRYICERVTLSEDGSHG